MKTFKNLFAVTAIVALLGTMLSPAVNFASASFSSELEGAYDFAADNGITSADSIDNANMYGSLTRVAMAKMMANFSMDVLGNEADTDMECSFPDVSSALDAQYDMGVTNACQLSLMGVGVDNFNPYGLVTRAEFGTVLSRALYGDDYNGADPYYADHLDALQDAGIMSNISNPMMLEVRGYVMLMMERGSDDTEATEGCSAEELLACITADDYDDCIADCSGDVEDEEDDVVDEDLAGELTVDLDATSPDSDTDLPVNVPRTTLLVFEVEADDADVTLHNLTLEFIGYGDYADVDNVTVYNSSNMKVSKTKNLNDTETTISFDNNLVVKEGGKETFTVAATIVGDTDTTYGLAVVDMDTSAEDIDGLPVNGDAMKAVTVENVGELTMNFSNAASSTITVGETDKLAGFKLKNDTDFEDVTLYAITLTLDGTDEDVFSDLVLYADGQEVADNLEFINDELVANIDYVIEKESAYIEFELFGAVSEIDNGAFTINVADEGDLYARGDKYGFNANIASYAITNVGSITVEGSEVTVSFDKSDIDEAKADAEDVLVGTIKLTALAGDYDMNSYTICVDTTNLTNNASDIKDLTLGGNSYDSLDENSDTDTDAGGPDTDTDWVSAVCPNATDDEYVYEDITLAEGVSKTLQLVVDFEDTAVDTDTVVFDVSFDNDVEVEDDYNDVTYDEGDISDIFSTVSFNTKTITIEGATFDSIVTTLNSRTVVLGNQEELVFKGKMTVGDADAVELTSIDFTDLNNGANTEDLNDIIQSATLTIGNKSYDDTDIEATKIEFDYINHDFDAGESNVIVELVVKFKTKDGVTDALEFGIAVNGDVTLEDAEGDELDAANITVVNTESCTLSLSAAGTLAVSWEKEDESSTVMANFTEQAKFALAGADEKVLLGQLKFDATDEDMKVELITMIADDVDGDFYNTYENIYVQVEGSEDYIGTDTVTYAANVLTMELDDLDIIVSKSTNAYVNIYATIKATDLDPNANEAGAIDGASVENLDVTAVEYTGESSGDDESDIGAITTNTVAENTVVVVNSIAAIELVAIEKTLSVGTHVIGNIVVTPTTQTQNFDAAGELFIATLDNLNLDRTASNCTIGWAGVIIREVGWANEVALVDATATALAGLLTEGEVNGATTFEIVVEVTVAAIPSDASIQLLIDDVTADVDFLTLDGGSIGVNYLLAPGISREQVVSTS